MMKRYSPLCAVLALTASIAGCSPDFPMSGASDQIVYPAAAARKIIPRGAANFTSKAAGFAIWLPERPTVKQSTVLSASREHDTMTFEAGTDSISYIIMATKIPAWLRSSSAEDLLSGAQEGFRGPGNKVMKDQAISLNGVPGRELLTSILNGAARMRHVIYNTHTMFYQVMAVGAPSDIESQKPQIDKVLGSFRILPESKRGPAPVSSRHKVLLVDPETAKPSGKN